MRKKVITLVLLVMPSMFFVGCGKDDKPVTPPESKVTEKEVVENYADIVLQNYEDALVDAKALKVAVDEFVANPTEAGLENVKKVWKVSRESYGPSEAYRFADGPIDSDDNGPEPLINSWPLDESYIDYVDNNGTVSYTGIVNNIAGYTTITKDLLVGLNQPVNGQGETSEENVSTGYHAIEFLLWGQDLTAPSENKAGQRKYTDYTTAPNHERRGQYLKLCADILVDDLQSLVDQWKKGGSYRTEFLALDTKKALGNMITGISILSKSELAGERMWVALESKSQEDEHSCFSDNTHRDIRLNFDGIYDVYTGSYKYGSKEIKGASVQKLIQQADPKIAAEVNAALEDAKAKVYATGNPFDIAISGGEDSPEGQKVKAAVQALRKLGDELVKGAKAIGVSASSEEEE